MSNLLQFGGGAIKSIQRGTITLTDGSETTDTATVTAVDTDKAILFHMGQHGASTTTGMQVSLTLTNSTTVTATRGGTAGTQNVQFQLVEYY